MTGVMESWRGASVDEVISQWGYPHEEQVIAGRKLLIWHRNAQILMPGVANTYGSTNVVGNTGIYSGITTFSGGGVISANCVRKLEVDANNRIMSWQWEGNNCPFMEVGPYSNWRRK